MFRFSQAKLIDPTDGAVKRNGDTIDGSQLRSWNGADAHLFPMSGTQIDWDEVLVVHTGTDSVYAVKASEMVLFRRQQRIA